MRTRALGIACVCMVGLAALVAPPAARASGWDYDFALYLFALGMDGGIAVRGRDADIDLSFSDILEDLEMAATGHLEANKRESRWGWFTDVFWSSLGRNFDQNLGEFDLNMVYLESAGTYAFGENFNLLAGLRYIDMDMTLDLRPLTDPPGPIRVTGDQNWTDLMVGGRYRKSFGERWGFSARGDLAGFGISGGSDLTWNVVLLGQFKVASRVGLILGYRWLDIDYENTDDLFVFDVRQAGPVFALNYSFY